VSEARTNTRTLTAVEVSKISSALRIAAGAWEGEACAQGTSEDLRDRYRGWAAEARQYAQMIEGAQSMILVGVRS
jgi:hypothetical protein